MSRRLAAGLLAVIASVALAACGGSNQVGDVVPRETPELTPPGGGTATLPATSGGSATTTATTTTSTADTTASGSSGTPAPTTGGSTATPAPAATPAPQSSSGGTAAPQTGDSTGGTTTGGGTGEAGGFSDFCTQNPGACNN